ncbi:MAG: hypothetical protein IJN20_04825 [Oscillospiraceae bacterium]|nr:hypothetical protein [Oscillospiraceae bacterium]
MEALFLKLVNMSITASWLVLAVIAVRLVFRRTPRWILCLLWGLVALRLIVPFSIESAFSLIPSAQPLPQNIIYTAQPELQSGIFIIDNTVNPMLASSMTPIEPASANPTQIWSFILSQIWILGLVLMMVYTAISYLLLKRKVAAAIPLGRGIKQCEFVDSPFVLGFLRPVIYLPFDMAESDMAYVLAHEKAHIRRKDHWWKPLGFLLLSIYWFNPLLWVAYILLCRDIEAACDERVIRDMGKDARRAYSMALLNCSVHRRRIAACPLAFGEVGVKNRVRSVMNYRKPTFWVILIAVIVSVIVAVCFLTDPKNTEPVAVHVEYFDRTMAHLEFVYDESFGEDNCQISETYTLERLENNVWSELENRSDEPASQEMVVVSAEDTDHDAWSILKWEDSYGRLPEGTFRIRKEMTVKKNSEDVETYPLYAEFTIGGTAEKYITYTLENLTSTGADLYEHENVSEDALLIYNTDGFWLEVLQNRQWKYMEPAEEIHPVIPQEKYYIRELHYPSSHIELDWSGLYGSLPKGTYRIAREITHTGASDLRLCTVYAEFSIHNPVYTWFDFDADNAANRHPKDKVIDLPGMEGTTLSYDGPTSEIRMITSEATTLVFSDALMIRSAYLTDLTGDGAAEICASVQTDAGMVVQVYDPSEKQLYVLSGDDGSYFLTPKGDKLCVLRKDNHWVTLEYGILGFSNHFSGEKTLEMQEIDSSLEALTKRVSYVEILNRRVVSLSRPQDIEKIMGLLEDLRQQVKPASADMFQKAQENMFDSIQITIHKELGEKTLFLSEDCSLVWEYGSQEAFVISDPEPLISFVESLTDGVLRKKTSGEPFASVDAPWDWCKNVTRDSIETAEVHVCLYTYRYGNTMGSTVTNGVLSYDTLETLLSILNQMPKDAFVEDEMLEKDSFHGFFIDQQKTNSAVALVDGVNDLAVIIRCQNGEITMLLTDEMDKVRQDLGYYLEPTQLWSIRDQRLGAFMQEVFSDPPVITYSVGAEYDWQDVIPFQSGDFNLELRLPEGWEMEEVSRKDNSGIRCRPEGITDGWIYFSFWPDGYAPVEEGRYISEGRYKGWMRQVSYPGEVATTNSLETRYAIWSYQKYDMGIGAFAIINDGADTWFPEYQDQISDMITLSTFTLE